MRELLSSIGAIAFLSNAYAGELPALPTSAKKATMEEFKTLADGKPVKVEIYDFDMPVSADLVWNWKKATITGKANVSGKR